MSDFGRSMTIAAVLLLPAWGAMAADCAPGKTGAKFAVSWTGPEGHPVSALKVQLSYPAVRVSLPGTATAPAARITGEPQGAVVVVNDADDTLGVLVSKAGSLLQGRLFTVAFDRCLSADAPAASDLSCSVVECTSSFGPVAGCRCTVGEARP
jgi:hypothetical protein